MANSVLAYLAVSALLVVATNATTSKVALNQEKKGISNPVGQVLKLMATMQKDMIADGKKTAKVYADKAKTCKDKDKSESKAIMKDNDKINKLAGEIKVDSTSKSKKQTKVAERQADQKQMADTLKATVLRCSKANAEYEANAADQDKAIASLKRAISTMKKRSGQIGKVKMFLQYSMNDLFDGKVPNKVSSVAADPAYKYHSLEINKILGKLLKSFTDEKKSEDDAWTKTSAACADEKASLSKKMKSNMDAMTKAGEQIQALEKEISKDREDLVKTESQLDSDATLLKTTTESCEAAAHEFDRRAKIQDQVVDALEQVMLFLGKTKTSSDAADKSAAVKITDNSAAADKRIEAIKAAKAKRREELGLSFLQAAPIRPVTSFLARGRTSVEQAKIDKVVSLLRDSSTKLSSPELSMMAMHVAGVNHFQGVQTMIQNLIERLLDESKAEISKNHFCIGEVEQANKARNYAKAKADAMSADLGLLETRKETLERDVADMKKEIAADNDLLSKLTTQRKDTRAKNMETIKKTKEGIESLDKAKAAYAEAAGAQAKVEVETTPQALTDEETMGTGAKDITALLEKITNDFDNMVSQTEEDDEDDQASFVKSSTALKSNIKAKEVESTMDWQDKKNTDDNIERTLAELQTQMGLVDDGLAMVASLKPICLDAGGMNFKDRKAKRDQEIAALKEAQKTLTHETL